MVHQKPVITNHNTQNIAQMGHPIHLENGPSFISPVPFDFVYACIFKDGAVFSETPITMRGHGIQLDLSKAIDTREYHVFAYRMNDDRTHQMVSSLRGNAAELLQERIALFMVQQ